MGRKLVALTIAIASIAGCGSDDDSADSATEDGGTTQSIVECWIAPSVAGQALRFQCGANRPPPGAGQVVAQLEPEERLEEEEFVYRQRQLDDFGADDWNRLRNLVESDEFVILPDDDLVRQVRQRAPAIGVATSEVDELFRVPTPTRVPRCRIRRGWRGIPILVCRY